MATLPNGLRATPEAMGLCFLQQTKIYDLLRSHNDLALFYHVRQCLNALRSGSRLKVSSQPLPALLPAADRQVNDEDWLAIYRASHELMRTLNESRLVLDVHRISNCIYFLAQGCILEADDSLKFRAPESQFETYVEYNKIIRDEHIGYPVKHCTIDDLEFELLRKVIDSGTLNHGDLLFYCHAGSVILTAETTRCYINQYVGGIYANDEPSIQWPIRDEKLFGPGVVKEFMSSKAFIRPSGFYVKRLPTLPDGRRFATALDYVDISTVKRVSVTNWPMSSEAFQLFGVTHKCWSDLQRPETFVLPGLYVEENDSCHAGGSGWNQRQKRYEYRNKNMLTIGNGVTLNLGTICTREDIQKLPNVAFGFLESWKPAEWLPLYGGSACSCGKPPYAYNGFTICSMCGSIRKRN